MLLYLNRINGAISKFEEFVVAYGTITLAILTISNVLSRNLFHQSLYFVEEVNEFLIVFITFLGTSYAARKGRHIRMSAIFDIVGDRVKKIMISITSLFSSLILFWLSYITLMYIRNLYMTGRVSPLLTIPLYLVWFWAPLGLFLTALQYALTFIKNLLEDDIWISFDEKSEYIDLEIEELKEKTGVTT